MEWLTEVNKMMDAWSDTQHKLWETWVDTLEQMGQAPTPELWRETIGAWEKTLEETQESQLAASLMWADSLLARDDAGPYAADWARRSMRLVQTWNEAQMELWRNWFDTLREASPGTLPASGEDIIKAWQDSAREAVESYLEGGKDSSAD